MNYRFGWLGLSFWIVISMRGTMGFAQQPADETTSNRTIECKLPDVRDELAERVAKDQEARAAMIGATTRKEDGSIVLPSDIFKTLERIDHENTQWLKSQVDRHGWLGKTLVGKQGARDAWLLVQHADRDLSFQKHCLELMKAMPQGEVTPINLAYLTDRVLSAEGKPQRYGTQCTMENGKASVKDVEDPDNLNQRRKAIGLGTIESYLKQIEQSYAPKSNNPKSEPGSSPKDDGETRTEESASKTSSGSYF